MAATSTIAGAAIATPSITSLSPSSVHTSGGTTVTIAGKSLTDGGYTTSVKVGTIVLKPTGKSSATKVTFVAPAELATVKSEAVSVSVAKKGQKTLTSKTKTLTYTVAPPPPTPPLTPAVTEVTSGRETPAAGPTAGGTTVTITGLYFASNAAVAFGSTEGVSTHFVSSTELTSVSPPEAVGSVNITVTNPGSPNEISAVDVDDTFIYKGSAYLPPATLIVGSGSETTYQVMDALGDIFEASPGCDLTNTTVDQEALQCSTADGSSGVSDVAGTVGGEAGLPVGDVNPLNDYYANAPGTGSGNGRNQAVSTTPVLLGGPNGIGAFNTSFARSSSYSAVTGLNYVGYATDAVSWVSEASIGGTPTAHSNVTDISKANLQAIWEGTLSCTISSVTVNMDWRCLQQASGVTVGGSPDPIDCYTTQTASGTYSTWQGFIGFTKNVNPPCSSAANEAGDPGDANVTTDHNNLTENQMGVVDHASDAANAIYFFSYGKFAETCNTNVVTTGTGRNLSQTQATCNGQAANDITQYGSINGILATQATIQGSGDDSGVTFPDPRILYNAYPNTVAPNPASPAVLNFIGAGGFLCRADMNTEIDPNTGVTYRSEIESAITNAGFFPLDINPTTDQFTTPAIIDVPSMTENGADYYPASNTNQAGGHAGYCIAKN
ncbi:MAG: IPT/TIG domain-containing protein [Acidimicrobiales bacterium]